MNLSLIISSATFLLIIILSLFVLLEDRRSRVNISFSLLGFAVAIWILSNIIANFTKNFDTALAWSKIAITWPTLFPLLFFYLIIKLCDVDIEKHRNTFIALLISGLIIVFFSPTAFNIEQVKIYDWGADYKPGPLYYLLFFYLLVGFGIAFHHLFRFYRSSIEPRRSQIKFIFIGSFLAILFSVITNIILPIFGYGIASIFGPPSVLLFVGFTAFAILKHHLFNIRVIVAELLVFAIWIFTLIRLLLSTTSQERIINIVFLALLIISGVLLIRSVLKEVRQREEIQKLSEFKTELLSIVAHQIKNPLVVIKGYASLVEDKTICDAEAVSDVFKKIKAAADKLVMLLNNLLDLHHFEEGKMHYEFQKIELNKFLKDIVEGFRIVARQRNLDLVFEPSPSEVYVDGDIYKLSQVFQNLIDNALKYTEKGWIRVSVKLSLPAGRQEASSAKDKEDAVIAISDSGKGMSRDLTQKLFQKFSRGAGESKALGSGLGLYISKEIVEAHHGKIWAESEGEGKGSAFHIEIPNK